MTITNASSKVTGTQSSVSYAPASADVDAVANAGTAAPASTAAAAHASAPAAADASNIASENNKENNTHEARCKTVLLASNNAHKVSEISHALNFPGWEFKTLRDLNIESNPEETASDFLGNARIKALAARKASGGMAVLADDSGLEVDALDGAPGVYSSRFAGEDASDADNNDKLLASLEGLGQQERSARFVCTLVFIDEDGSEVHARGTVEGYIGFELQGDAGFGYDPLFWPDVFNGSCTLAEVPQARKNEVSHRGNALRSLRAKLEEHKSDSSKSTH